MRTGTSQLGLKVDWRYELLPPGTALQPTFDAIALDIGGAVVPGIVDQHQGGFSVSTAELVFAHPEHVYGHLMNGWLQAERAGSRTDGRAWRPCLITHVQPDFDALVSCYLARELIERGRFPIGARELADYAGRVDMGRYRVDLTDRRSATVPVHMAWLVIQNLTSAGFSNDREQIGSSIDFGRQTQQDVGHEGLPNRPSRVLGRTYVPAFHPSPGCTGPRQRVYYAVLGEDDDRDDSGSLLGPQWNSSTCGGVAPMSWNAP